MKAIFKSRPKLDAKLLLKEYGFILIGTFLMAVGFVVFISPLKLAPGGVYGIAIILHHTFGFPIGMMICRRIEEDCLNATILD